MTNEQGDNLSPQTIIEGLDKCVKGQAYAKETVAVAFYQHLLRHQQDESQIENSVRPEKNTFNVFLLGPTGCGKTHLVRNAAKLIGAPFCETAADNLTIPGYHGEKITKVFSGLLQQVGGDPRRAEQAVIFLDEIDALARRGMTNEVGGTAMQKNLLKYVEGTIVEIPQPAGTPIRLDTGKMLFVVAGAFSNDTSKNGARSDSSSQSRSLVLPDCVTPDELHRKGMIEELVGRFGCRARLHRLSADELYDILVHSPSSPFTKVLEYGTKHGIDIQFTRDAVNAFVDAALQSPSGARELDVRVQEDLRFLFRDLPDLAKQKVVTVRVDEKALVSGKPLSVVKGKNRTSQQIVRRLDKVRRKRRPESQGLTSSQSEKRQGDGKRFGSVNGSGSEIVVGPGIDSPKADDLKPFERAWNRVMGDDAKSDEQPIQ